MSTVVTTATWKCKNSFRMTKLSPKILERRDFMVAKERARTINKKGGRRTTAKPRMAANSKPTPALILLWTRN